MSTDRDTTRIVRSWLDEGVTQLPDRVLDAVLDQVPATPQRRTVWFARRTPIMNRIVAVGLGAVAVVALLLIGSRLLGPPNNVGAGDPTPTPEATAESSVAASPTPAGGIREGPFALTDGTLDGDGPGGVPATVTISAPGWYGEPNEGILVKNDNADPPDGAGMIGPWYGDLYVYGDPCQWSSTQPDAPATTVDELVAALTAQASRNASAPIDITLDGYDGKSITLHVPDDANFGDCDERTFGSWTVGEGLEPYRFHQGPGQIDELWILDRDGVLTVIDAGYYAETPSDHVDELRAIIESINFE